MSPHPVLIIHADAERRQALRAFIPGREVFEAANRTQAAPYLTRGHLSLVLSQALEFRRLLRELERHSPGTPRAVLCPDDPEAMQQLSQLASEGYDFATVPEHSLETLRALLEPRSSARVAPRQALEARFSASGVPFTAEVAEVGNDGLGLLLPASAPIELLAPGRRLEPATVRGSHGEVLAPRSWVVRTVRAAPDGRRRVGVTIEPRQPELESRQPLRLRDDVRIRGLLRRAVNRQALFDVRLADESRHRHYTQVRLDGAGRLVLSAPLAGPAFSSGEIALVSFELMGSQVEGVTAILEAGPEHLVLAQPRSVLRRDRREALRVKLPPSAPGRIHFTSPLTGAPLTGRVVDLHPTGVSFEVEAGGEVLPPGLRLRGLELELEGQRCRCEAVVQTSRLLPGAARQRVGLKLSCEPGGDRQVLLQAWLKQLVPDISCGSTLAFPAIWALFQHEEVNFPDHPLDAPETLEVLGRAHEAVGAGSHGVAKSFVFTDEGTVRGHASGLRTHSRTWLSQHLAVRTGYHRQTHVSQSLVNLSFDYAEALGDVEYLRGLWRVSNRWTNRVYGTATARLMRPGLSYVASFTPMRIALSGELRSTARPSTPYERLLLMQQLRRTWDPVRLRADDLVEGELELESLAPRYAALGLERSRHVGVVEGPHGPRGWVLIERMTPGLFWAEWYDAFRVVLAEPHAPDADEVRLSLARYALQDARARGRAHTHCLAADADVAGLEAAGFQNLGRVMEFCAHRSMNREMTAQLLAIFERLSRRSSASEEGGEA